MDFLFLNFYLAWEKSKQKVGAWKLTFMFFERDFLSFSSTAVTTLTNFNWLNLISITLLKSSNYNTVILPYKNGHAVYVSRAILYLMTCVIAS